jgi:hypothetical protein
VLDRRGRGAKGEGGGWGGVEMQGGRCQRICMLYIMCVMTSSLSRTPVASACPPSPHPQAYPLTTHYRPPPPPTRINDLNDLSKQQTSARRMRFDSRPTSARRMQFDSRPTSARRMRFDLKTNALPIGCVQCDDSVIGSMTLRTGDEGGWFVRKWRPWDWDWVRDVWDSKKSLNGAQREVSQKAQTKTDVHGTRISTEIYTRGCHWFPTPAP